MIGFSIDIDDNRVRQRVLDNAYNDIIEHIEKYCLRNLPEKNWGTYNSRTEWDNIDWVRLAQDSIDKLLEEHKDIIIQKTVDALTNKVSRRKAFKEAVKELNEEA